MTVKINKQLEISAEHFIVRKYKAIMIIIIVEYSSITKNQNVAKINSHVMVFMPRGKTYTSEMAYATYWYRKMYRKTEISKYIVRNPKIRKT